jgi:UDP-N-acetylmuramoyl-tripeptide--D-alanyl-D-alanine ligase
MATAMRGRRQGNLPAEVTGISIDSRTIERGEAFFAVMGENRDGHEFVGAALAAGAGLAVVAENKLSALPNDAPLLVVADVLAALVDLARAARSRSRARVIAVTGSVGKTGTKEALRRVLARVGETHASVASYNNHWGVPLSLARLPASARYGVFELGMNHAGEIASLSRLARPHVAIITAIEPVHLEYFSSVEAIADAKSEIFLGVEPAGAAVINRDSPQFERLKASAEAAGIMRVVSFGEHAEADARLVRAAIKPDRSTIEARILGIDIVYKLGAPGQHVAMNSLAVLAAAALLGADLAVAALALADLKPAPGRGENVMLELPGGTALLIDESYNANLASMRAALALLGQAPVGLRGRRIAVLGDMLELGPTSPEIHRALLEPVLAHGTDLVFCCGPLMKALWEALPVERRGGYALSSAELEPEVIAGLRGGDAIMIKGSLGSRMGLIVKALVRRFSGHAAADTAATQG